MSVISHRFSSWMLAATVLMGPGGAAHAADSAPLLTVLEGEAGWIDGARLVAAVPGLRAGPGTLIDTTATTALLRLEWADGSTLDLGPSTRVMLAPRGINTADRKPPAVYQLSGWTKYSPAQATAGLVTPALDISAYSGAVVTEVAGGATVAFIETGRVQALDRRGRGEPVAVKTGQSLHIGAGTAAMAVGGAGTGGSAPGTATVAPRLPAGWLQKMPKSFRDAVPRRYARFGAQAPDAPALPGPSYAQLQPWLAAEPALRQDFPQRFAPLLKDRAFADAVAARLNVHPEWEQAVRAARAAQAGR